MLKGKLFIFDTRILFVGENLVNKSHKHYTASVVISRDGPLTFVVDNEEIKCLGILVYPNARQSLDAGGHRFFSLQVDRETPTFGALEPLFGRKRYKVLADNLVAQLQALELDKVSLKNAENIWQKVITLISGKNLRLPQVDSRIRLVADKLKASLAEVPNAQALATLAGLSESRLIHLFSEQLGLPIRSYIKWLRLKRAVEEINAGASITDAAYCAGFSDSAHLSRTFKEMFGINPKKLVQNSQNVQVFSGT